MSQFMTKIPSTFTVVIALLTVSNSAHAGGGDYVSQTFNFVLLVVILFLLTRKKISQSLHTRAETIQYNIDKGQKELEIAQAHYEELQTELSNLDKRIESIHIQTQEDIKSLNEEFAQNLETEKQRIQSNMERSIQDEYNQSKEELKEVGVQLAMQIVHDKLGTQINADDHKRFADGFMQIVKEGSHV